MSSAAGVLHGRRMVVSVTLRQLSFFPDGKYSGLHLMCLMFAGFKRVAPETDGGMDLEEPFLTALELHAKGEGRP